MKSLIKKIASPALQTALVNVRNEINIARTSASPSSAAFRALAGKRGLKLHLGCGADVRAGWINIDLMLKAPAGFDVNQPNTAVISYDLRNGLAMLPEGCASYVFSSHFFEHLTYWHGLQLMRDCYRALAPEGVFRIVLPDYAKFYRAYLAGDRAFFEPLSYGLIEPQTATLADYMTYAIYQYGEHCTIYDEARLETVLRNIGFRVTRVSDFQPEVDVDNELRRKYSLFFEAMK